MHPIDNSVLLIDISGCKPTFAKFEDNEIFIENYGKRQDKQRYISKEMWEYLKGIYGSKPEQPLVVGWNKNEEIKETKYVVIYLNNNNTNTATPTKS